MIREKSNFNVLERILHEREKRGWTEYKLASNAGLTQSTISTWYRKGLQPSVASIEKICDGLGISLSQFFSTEQESVISEEQEELFAQWSRLDRNQRAAVLALLKTM